MTKLALSVAAMLLASSAAFAGNAHHHPRTAQQTAVDSNATASIPQGNVDTRMTTGAGNGSVQDTITRNRNESLWGH